MLITQEIVDEFFIQIVFDGCDVSLAKKTFDFGADPDHDTDPSGCRNF